MPETEIFWTANWPPLQDFAVAMGLVFVSTGHKTRLGHFALCFGVFRSVRRIEVFLELVFTTIASVWGRDSSAAYHYSQLAYCSKMF